MALEYSVVDAFTPKAYSGNPACVIVVESTLPVDRMQIIAREFNLSETAYLTPQESKEDGVAVYGLRWFTPTVEIALCGHATLASAHVLFSSFVGSEITTIKFQTMSGELIAKRVQGDKIELEFPGGLLTPAPAELTEKVKKTMREVTGKDLKLEFIGTGSGVSFEQFLVVEVNNGVDLKAVIVRPEAFAALSPPHGIVLITSKSNEADFVSRVFAPGMGILEDPVTGAAHCVLGPYWETKLGKAAGEALHAKQVSLRGGEITVIWDEKSGRCKLQGQAVTVSQGRLLHV